MISIAVVLAYPWKYIKSMVLVHYKCHFARAYSSLGIFILGAAGLAVGHPFDTVKVASYFVL